MHWLPKTRFVLHSTVVNSPCFGSKTRVSGAKHILNVSKTLPYLNMRIHCTIGWLANRSSIRAKTLAQKPKLDLDTVTNLDFGVNFDPQSVSSTQLSIGIDQ